MGSLTLNNTTLNKYFGILKNLDDNTKKKLIIELTESIQSPKNADQKLENIFGAWQDNRTADEIINDIESSRSNYRNIEEL